MILIFGGTTEGRLAVDVCEEAGKPFYYSTKSSLQQVEMHHGVRLTGAMTIQDIKDFCQQHDIRCIVDAAHPFAENLHRTISEVGLPVIRWQRMFSPSIPNIIYCKDYADAIQKMEAQNLSCLLALSGVNTIQKTREYWSHHRTFFRVLKREESLEVVTKQQFPTTHLIFYNEDCTIPSEEQEKQLMRQVGCDAILTKESGETGGFEVKVQAALGLGLKVFVVQHPDLALLYATPEKRLLFHQVSGKHGLRREIENLVPDFFPLKTGFTTGSCATAATKAALLSLVYDEQPEEVSFALPDGEIMSFPVTVVEKGVAFSIKDSSDDPDVTRGCKILSKITRADDTEIHFLQGEGVGTVTLPGLGIPVGGPAVNQTPRKMIVQEIREISEDGFNVTISVENGAEIAKKTFNPKVGVVGGISIIGTSGIVSPLSNEAFIHSITREIEVAKAIGCQEIGLVSGKKSEDALKAIHSIRCIHYGNFIGESLKAAYKLRIPKVVLGIMLGKAVKLAEGSLDTHSHKGTMNKAFLHKLAIDCGSTASPNAGWEGDFLARELWNIMPPLFFERITELCYKHCRTVFPEGKLEIKLICDAPHS